VRRARVPSISLCEIFRKSTGSDDLWLQRIAHAARGTVHRLFLSGCFVYFTFQSFDFNL
jgi:hypothetical protein